MLSFVLEKFITATKKDVEITVHKFIGHRTLFPFQDKNVAFSCECLSSKFILRDECVFRCSHRPSFHVTIFVSHQRESASYCMIRSECPLSSPSLPIRENPKDTDKTSHAPEHSATYALSLLQRVNLVHLFQGVNPETNTKLVNSSSYAVGEYL